MPLPAIAPYFLGNFSLSLFPKKALGAKIGQKNKLASAR